MWTPEEFNRLVADAVRAEQEIDHCPDMEPYLLAVLNYVKMHPDGEAFFKTEFSKFVQNDNSVGYYLVPFCMRELRWPEVREAARLHMEMLQRANQHARFMNYFSDLIQAYEELVWDSAILFPYYANRELTADSVPPLIEKIRSGTYEEQLNAVMALESIGPVAIDALPALQNLLAECANKHDSLANFTRSAIEAIQTDD
jgi:hypothetical protein